jgi:subtilisin family serine protease
VCKLVSSYSFYPFQNRVLNRSGKGTISGIIAGVNHVAKNAVPGDVANMSLGGGISPSLDLAVSDAASLKSIYFTLAAGNDAADAILFSPARVDGPTIFTISAMNNQDEFASFSNFGNPPIDYCAPGVDIFSTYKNGAYATMSGTSMAAPHAAGVLLATNGQPERSGTVNNDPDGTADPIIHI